MAGRTLRGSCHSVPRGIRGSVLAGVPAGRDKLLTSLGVVWLEKACVVTAVQGDASLAEGSPGLEVIRRRFVGPRWQSRGIGDGFVKRHLAMEVSWVREAPGPITGNGVEQALAKAGEKSLPGRRIGGGGDGMPEGSAK